MKYTPKILEQRGWFAAGRTLGFVCPKCGATIVTMPDVCSAPLEEACPGFEAVETAYKEFEANYPALAPRGELR